MKPIAAKTETPHVNRSRDAQNPLLPKAARKRSARRRFLGLTIAFGVGAVAVTPAQAQTVTVDFSTQLGTPTYRATGFIYGLSEDGTQPPTHFLSDIKNQFYRVGGAQLGCPNGGWVNSTSNYTRRFNTVKTYHSVAKNVGGKVILLVHDLWGADLVCPINEYPGDNNNWSRFDTFINQVINDVKAANMAGPDLHWDIWNEPDCCGFFGNRSQSQYLATWKRGFQAIRAALPDAVIVGPSSNIQPGSPWFNAFLDYIKTNNVVPDYLSWHQLNTSDILDSKNAADTGLASRGLTVKGYQCNEYGDLNLKEQTSGMSAWFIGRMERLAIDGARANWGMYGGLWDTMGDLVANKGSGYQPAGAWWVYQRYAQMTGTRVAATTPDRSVDATGSKDPARANAMVLLGRRHTTGNATLNLTNLQQAPYLVVNGQVRALLERIPEGSSVSAPTKVSETTYNVSNNQATVTWNWTGPDDAYVVTLTGSTATGGTTGSGGASSVGGSSAKGGASSVGGSSAKGGTSSLGGSSARGGTSSVGGSSIVAMGGTTIASGGTAAPSSVAGSSGAQVTVGGAASAVGGTGTVGVGGTFAQAGSTSALPPPSSGGTSSGTGTVGVGVSGEEGSCGCRAAGSRGSSPWALLLGVVGLAMMARRRKVLGGRA